MSNRGNGNSRYLDPASPEYRARMEKLIREHFESKESGRSWEESDSYSLQDSRYPTYTLEEVQELMKAHLEYKDSKKTEEGFEWDSLKTTESEEKI